MKPLIMCPTAFLVLVAVACIPARAEFIVDQDMTIDGRIDDDVSVIEGASPPTTLNLVDPASLGEYLRVYDSSIVHMSGGTVDERLYAYGTSVIHISGGLLLEDLVADDLSTANVSGGDLSDYVIVRGFGTANIVGGTIWGVAAYADGSADISGGLINAWPQETGLIATGSSTISIRGTGFNYPYGKIPDASGTLTGTLADGTSIHTGFNITADGAIVLVPEPIVFALLLPCLFVVAAYAVRQRKAAD